MIRTLLVDDHTGMRRAVRRLLEISGEIEVVGEAQDGEEALEELESLEPDVVLLDLRMPRLDGIGVLMALKSRIERPKVVVLTMNGARGMREKVLAAGADALVSKKMVFHELLPAIRAVVEH